ncbi:MAG: hypothetical protein WCD34_14290 [Candidatus Acidiferrum sp.]
MKWQLLAVCLSLVCFLPVTSAQTSEPVSVDRMCGKLVSMEALPENGKTNSFSREAKPISHARVRLFPPTANGDCCSLMTPSAEVFSGRDGEFQFKKIEAGDYWLVAMIAEKEYKLLIRYQPGKKSAKNCSDFQYTLEEGKFQFVRTATVTVD